jgi:hypothetical protein
MKFTLGAEGTREEGRRLGLFYCLILSGSNLLQRWNSEQKGFPAGSGLFQPTTGQGEKKHPRRHSGNKE